MIILFIIVAVLCLLVIWLLTAPLILLIDTRVPAAQLRWISIGSFRIWYEGEEWRLHFRVFFFQKTIRVADIKRKKKKPRKKKKRKPVNATRMLTKLFRVLRSFRVEAWEVAIDSGDNATNAKLFPLNHAPRFYHHVLVNFRNENYFFIRIRNRIGKMVYAYLR